MQNLKQYRKSKGYTAKEFAQNLQMSVNTYRSYENGKKNPSINSLLKIADQLELSTDYLLNRIPNFKITIPVTINTLEESIAFLKGLKIYDLMKKNSNKRMIELAKAIHFLIITTRC